ncbi:MAG: Spi family protease inhibitor, partial [Bacteroidales bacterium]|nr:Spi family protease inhibitor [Bacteroidales bacterium]
MKKVCLIMALALTAAVSFANPVGKERAQRVARNAVSLLCAERHNLSPALPVELTDITATLGAERLHVFTYRQGDVQGFVVISGDDIASPLLAFSDEGEPDATLTHPAFLMQLRQYDRQIQAGQAAKANAPAHIFHKW